MLDAAFRRVGVLRVDPIAELFDMAEVLAKQPRPRGPAAGDRHQRRRPRRAGHRRPDRRRRRARRALGPRRSRRSTRFLPAAWSHGNPIDILGDADPERYAQALEVAAKDPDSDGLLVDPHAAGDDRPDRDRRGAEARSPRSPASRCSPAGWAAPRSRPARRSCDRAGIPTFAYPDTAARVFTSCGATATTSAALYETPDLAGRRATAAPIAPGPRPSIAAVRAAGRTLLTEVESKQLLAAYGIPTVRDPRRRRPRTRPSPRPTAIGYPVVLKLYSQTITHKTDVGGVQLNLTDAEAVRRAYRAIEAVRRRHAGAEHFQGVTVQPMVKLDGYELILGSSLDPQFGPVLLFGTGGQLVEVFKDRALALPPLNTTLARRMMEQTKIYTALQGRARPPAGGPGGARAAPGALQPAGRRAALDQGDRHQPAARLARAAAGAGRPRDPARAGGRRGPAAPARHPPLSRPSTSAPWTAKDGTDRSRSGRSGPRTSRCWCGSTRRSPSEPSPCATSSAMKLSARIAHERLTRICFIDYDREMALVADYKDPQTGEHEILASAG